MKVRITTSFRERLNQQVKYIAKDKPQAARDFKTDILKKIKEIPRRPLGFRKSIFFDRNDTRDMIYKGYIVVFKIDESKETLEVFGFNKWEDSPFKSDMVNE